MKNNSSSSDLGLRLRALRQSHGWRIADVSEMTGLAISTISKVENNRMSLTFDKLLQLTQGLGIDMAELFAGAPAEKPRPTVTALRSVDRATDANKLDHPNYGYWYLNTDLSHKEMTPMLGLAKMRTMAEFGDYIRHPGQEFLFVLEGKVTIHSEFYQPTTLEPGESMYIDSNMGHAYLAGDEGDCRFLVVCWTGPDGELEKHIDDFQAKDGAQPETPQPRTKRVSLPPASRKTEAPNPSKRISIPAKRRVSKRRGASPARAR